MRVMRLTTLFLTIAIAHTYAAGMAQNVTLSGKNLTLEQVLAALEKQTSYVAVGNKELFAAARPVSVDASNLPLKEFLNEVLRDQGITYTIKGKNIILSREAGWLTGQFAVLPVKGIVRGADGTLLAGASIRVKGTTKGIITDEYGRFSIDVKKGDVLVISFTGYTEYEVKVGNEQAINAVLQPKDSELGGITINGGYYKTTDRTKTGSIYKVTSKEIERQPVTSPLMALQGRVPGLDITPGTGVAGSAVKVEIRGRNSVRFNTAEAVASSPLYVVDGIPIDPTPLRTGSDVSETLFTTGYDPLGSINPANIESIEVLKDADATAIYGSRGANGVILITTKQGNRSGRTSVNARVYTGEGQISRYMKLMNTQQYVMMRKEAFANDNATPRGLDYDVNGFWDTTRYTDWQKVLLGHSAKIHDVQAGIEGGNSNTSFRFNMGYHKETTIYGDDFGSGQYSGQLSLTHTSPNKRFKAGFSVNYGSRKGKTFEHTQFMSAALRLAPNAPKLYHEDGSLNWEIVTRNNILQSSFQNPAAMIKNTNEMKEGSLITSANLSYDILPGLSFSSTLGYTDLNGRETIKKPIAAQNPLGGSQNTASAKFGSNTRQSYIIEPQLSYTAARNAHRLNVILGSTWQESNSIYQNSTGYGYTSDFLLNSLQAATNAFTSEDAENQSKYLSVYTRINYSWMDRYLLSLTGRRDGSSRFGPGKRFGNFGSLGAAWIFSEEKFAWEGLRFMSYGKLRGSYGVTGNDQIGDYGFMDRYTISNTKYQGYITLMPTALFNPDFSWEETRKLELALELGLLKDRIYFEVSWYRNRSSNQLIGYVLPAIAGFEEVSRNLNATVDNNGLEALVRVKSIQTRNFRMETSFNISSNRNKLVSFPGLEFSSYKSSYKIGEPLSIRQLLRYKGLNPQTGLHEFEDPNNNGEIDMDDFFLSEPTDRVYYGGLTHTMNYKSFELSFTLQFSKQRKPVYDQAPQGGYRNMNRPLEFLSRWKKPGDVTHIAKFSQDYVTTVGTVYLQGSDGNVADASFVRLKTLSASWLIPAAWLRHVSMSQASIFLQGQNLLTFTNYPALDPETWNAVPPLRMITAGLNIRF